MNTSVPLRRALRRIPEFRSLPSSYLNQVIEQMVGREYKPGDVLFHIQHPIDFFGVIQGGEVIVEYRFHGRTIRSVRLAAGEHVRPHGPKGAGRYISILAHAASSARFHVLQSQQFEILQSCWRAQVDPHRLWRTVTSGVWVALVAFLIVFLSGEDIARIGSGLLYIKSFQIEQTAGDSSKSLHLLEAAESLYQDAVYAYNQEGYILFQHQDLMHANSAFKSALRIEQTNGPSLNNLAVTYYTLKQIQEAAPLLQEAVANDPDNAKVRYNLGIVLMEQSDNTQALRQLKEASYIDSGWALPYMQQAALYLQMGDDFNAEQAARKSAILDDAQYPTHLILAIALYNQGKDKEALVAVEQALQIASDSRVSRFYHALVLYRLGKMEEALLTLQELLATSEDPRELSRIQAEIEVMQPSQQNFPAETH